MLRFVKLLAIVAVLVLVVAPTVTVSTDTKGNSQLNPLGGPGGGVRPTT